MSTKSWDPDEIVPPVVMGGYILTGMLVLAGAWYPLLCGLLFGHPCDQNNLGITLLDMFFFLFAGVAWVPAILIILVYRREWLMTLPATLAVLNSLAVLANAWIGSAEYERPVAVATSSLYTIVALVAAAIWFSRGTESNPDRER